MTTDIPTAVSDPINAKILAVSEDLISGFQRHPFQLIAEKSGVPLDTVITRTRAMLEAGIIRRVRQTMLATKLAHGALVAWKAPEEKLNDAFDFMAKQDPFSGHVVIRSTDTEVSGSGYRLWTTLKVPVGESLDFHATKLLKLTGATEYLLMPANGVFALGVGHVRRKTMEPGEKADEPAVMMTTVPADLSPEEWNRPLLRNRRNPQQKEGHRSLLHLPRTRQTKRRNRRTRHTLQRPLPLGNT
jgi:DNA-binding Lrp family transcriptional regulator